MEITVPRDRGASFEPKIVAKRQRRLTGVDEMVISLSAKGLAAAALEAFAATWEARYPAIIKLWRAHWSSSPRPWPSC